MDKVNRKYIMKEVLPFWWRIGNFSIHQSSYKLITRIQAYYYGDIRTVQYIQGYNV